MIEYHREGGIFADFKKRFEGCRGQIFEALSTTCYRHYRYGVKSGVMLIYTTEPFGDGDVSDLLRRTDDARVIDEVFMLVVFDHAEGDDALKAAQKFLYGLLNRDPRRQCYAALVETGEQEVAAVDTSGRLFLILQQAIEAKMLNQVANSGDLEI